MIHAPTGLPVLGDRPYPVRGTADASLAVRRVAEWDFTCARGVRLPGRLSHVSGRFGRCSSFHVHPGDSAIGPVSAVHFFLRPSSYAPGSASARSSKVNLRKCTFLRPVARWAYYSLPTDILTVLSLPAVWARWGACGNGGQLRRPGPRFRGWVSLASWPPRLAASNR